jgi:hypothetical protein
MQLDNNVNIRRALPGDTRSIVDIVSLAWQRDYAALLPAEFLQGEAVHEIDSF